MIVKQLIIDRHVYLAANKMGIDEDTVEVIELRMPLETYWQAKNLLKDADYLLSEGQHISDVNDVYKKFFKKVAPYASLEKDRLRLYARAK